MKKRICIVLTLIICLVLCLAACNQTPLVNDEGSACIVVETASGDTNEYVVPLDKVNGEEGLVAVLDYLKENHDVSYTMTRSEFGAYLTQVGELQQDDGAGVFLYLYTSIAEDQDVSEYKQEKEYKGAKLISAGVGASAMHISDGCVIYIGTIVYN